MAKKLLPVKFRGLVSKNGQDLATPKAKAVTSLCASVINSDHYATAMKSIKLKFKHSWSVFENQS